MIYLLFVEENKDTEEETNNPKNVYNKMCENLKVIPCRYFLAHVDKQRLIMKYHQFSDDEVRAISKPLWVRELHKKPVVFLRN